MYRFLRFAAQLLAVLCLLFFFNSIALSQENALKSKYSFTTSPLKSAQKFYSIRRYPEALSAYDAIIKQAENQQNYEELVYAMEKKALVLRKLNRYDEAISTMDRAIKISLANLPKGHFLVAKSYYTRGTMDHSRANYYSARAFLDTAMVYYRSARSYDSALYKRIVEYKLYAYQYSEGSQDTLLTYLRELVELETVESNGDPNPNLILRYLQSYPTIYIQKGDFEQALAYAIQAYQYAKKNRKRISNRLFAESQYYLAEVLYNKKDFQKAIEVSLQAMPLVESTPRAEMPEYYAFNNLLAISYMAIGEYQKALPYLEKAAQILKDDENLFDDRSGSKFNAVVMINMGLCYNYIGQTDKAKGLLMGALARMKELVSIPNPDFHRNYERLGDFFSSQNDWEKALMSYDSALRNGLVSYKTSITSFPENLEGLSISYVDLRTLMKKAGALKEIGTSKIDNEELLIASEKYVKKTHGLLKSNRDALVASEGKLFLSESFKELYEIGIEASYYLYQKTGKQEYFQSAIDFSKQSKAILFLEQSQEFDLVNSNSLSKDLKEVYFRKKGKIESLQSTFYSLIDESVTSDSIVALNENLLKARVDQELLKDSIRSILVDYGEITSSVERLFTENNDSKIRSNHGLIEFFYGEDNIYTLSRTSEQSYFHKVEVNDKLTSSIDKVLQIVSRPPNVDNIDSELSSFVEASSHLYDKLLKPTVDQFDKEINHLVIVPDDILSRIPFQVLIKDSAKNPYGFNELDYLIKSYSIQYRLSSELYQNATGLNKLGEGLLAVGFKGTGNVGGKSAFGALPGTENEIKFLKASVKGTFLIGPSGSKEAFIEKASEFDVLHLAVHGKADSVNRYQSSLIFYGSEDNVLNTSDLYLAGLKARLAVLSACESGIGVVNKGEGTFSIARGFALVGVPSIVMSLWKVNDNVTSELMVDMYQGFLSEGMPINMALRESKLKYIKSSDQYTSHPYYWAAFLQLGDDMSYDTNRVVSWKQWIYVGSILCLLVAGALYRKRKRAN